MSRYTDPQWSSSAVVTIDTQMDTLDGQPMEIPGTSSALPRMEKILCAYRRAGLPIIHVVRLYLSDGSNVDSCRRANIENGMRFLMAGSAGSQLAPELLPEPDLQLDPKRLLSGEIQTLGEREIVLYKPRWGAFYGTCLEAYLKDNRITTLVFCGANFCNCPRASIYQASERDLRIVVARDALSGLYEKGIEELRAIGASVLTTEEILGALGKI